MTLELLGGVADCSCCKKKDKGGRGLLRLPLEATVLVLLMLQIYRYRPSVRRILPQRSDMILLAEKKVYHVLEGCQGGRGRGKKEIELRIHMTVFRTFSLPKLPSRFVSNLMIWSKRFLVHAAILGLQVGICKF